MEKIVEIDSIKVENCGNIDVEVSPSVSVSTGDKELEVTSNVREYRVTGDSIYIPKLYDDAPQWMKDLIQTVVDVETAVVSGNIDTAISALQDMVNELEVAKNTYTQSVISSNDIDLRITTAIETLNNTLADADATILALAQTKVTPDAASAIALDVIRSSLADGDIQASIDNLESTFVDRTSANATSIETLNSTLEGVVDDFGNDITANATATQYLNTYVGLDENGAATGIGTLDGIINEIQNQIDGSITSWFETGEPTLNNTPASTWTTDTEKTNHIGDMYYDRGTGYSYRFAYEDIPDDTPDEGIIYSWIRITDTDITKALADAAQAQETADGKVTTFYQEDAPIAEGEGDIWIDSNDGNKMYRWNGSSWGSDLVGAMVANASAVTELEADLASTNTTVGGHTTQLSTVDTRISKGVASVETKWEYNSDISITGGTYNSGFGLVSSATDTGSINNPVTSGSEFWVKADSLRFTDATTQNQPFSIVNGQTKFNGLVSFSNATDVPDFATNNDVAEANSELQSYLNSIAVSDNFESYANNTELREKWISISGLGGWISSHSASGQFGMGIGASSNPAGWVEHQDFFAVNDTDLYRIKGKVKSNNSDGKCYLGIICYQDDKTTKLNTSGANSNGSSHYIAISGKTITNEYTEYIGYFKGQSTSGVGGQHNNINDPAKLYSGTSFVRGLFIANYSGTSGYMYLDDFVIEKVDEALIEEINNLTKVEDISWQSEVQNAINDNATTIDGGKIVTNTALVNNLNALGGIEADTVKVNSTLIDAINVVGGIKADSVRASAFKVLTDAGYETRIGYSSAVSVSASSNSILWDFGIYSYLNTSDSYTYKAVSSTVKNLSAWVSSPTWNSVIPTGYSYSAGFRVPSNAVSTLTVSIFSGDSIIHTGDFSISSTLKSTYCTVSGFSFIVQRSSSTFLYIYTKNDLGDITGVVNTTGSLSIRITASGATSTFPFILSMSHYNT